MRLLFLILMLFGFSSFTFAQNFSSGEAFNNLNLVSQSVATNNTTIFMARDWVFGNLEADFAGRTVSTRLLLWSLPWMGASILGLTLSSDEKTKGFWSMSGAWGFINSAIAMIGFLTPEPQLETMRNLLLINAGVDVLYIAAGAYMLSRTEAYWQGAGWGVIIQGTFLLVFDLWQGLAIRF